MLGPIRLIRDAGDWLADGAGALAAKSSWPKSWSAEKKARIGGIAATVAGAAVCFAAAEVALGGLLLGGLIGWLGIFPPLGLQMMGIGAAALAPAIFGAGMVQGADRHCGIKTAVLNAGDRMMDRFVNFLRPGRAPSVTTPEPEYGPEPKPTSRFNISSKPSTQFATAVDSAPVAAQPAAALQPAPQGPRA